MELNRFDNSWYDHGSLIKRVLWYITSLILYETALPYPSKIKTIVLIFFGAHIGKRVIIKPSVKIKYPWKLHIGDDCWIGEKVWIDNLGGVRIGSNVCLSQGVYIVCGSHDYKSKSFDLVVKDVFIGDSVWICAKSVVLPGVHIDSGSIILPGSVVHRSTAKDSINGGVPSYFIRKVK